MVYIKSNENRVYEAVQSGELEIDKQGRIWRLATRGGDRWRGGIRLNPCKRRRAEHRLPSGYLQIRLMINGVRFNSTAHRLVWRTVNGPIPVGLVMNHRNGIKSDNRPENLEVVTPSENQKHAVQILGVGRAAHQWGGENHQSKLTDAQVEAIRGIYAVGETTQESLAKIYGVAFQSISKIVRGSSRPKQLGPRNDYTYRRYGKDRTRNSKGQFCGA